MLNMMKESIYKKKYAKEDAQLLLEVLGNQEKIVQIIAERTIEGGKWRHVVVELYKLLEGEDKNLLLQQGYALELGEYAGLWSAFAHHEQARIDAMPNPLEVFCESVWEEAIEEGFEPNETMAMMQKAMKTVIERKKQEALEAEQIEAEQQETQKVIAFDKEENKAHPDAQEDPNTQSLLNSDPSNFIMEDMEQLMENKKVM